MEWTDHAIVLGCRKHGESSVILEVMTPTKGRQMGIVRGGRSRKTAPLLQSGNSLKVTWKARLESHLGQFTIELETSRAAKLMASPLGTYGMQFIAELTRLLPERDPHPYIYQALSVIVDEFQEGDVAGELMVRYELALLAELGFRLDLSQCAATGQEHDLHYVSPKSGRAVSREAGEPWKDRLLALPPFLKGEASGNRVLFDELQQGFTLTGFFLDKYIYNTTHKDAPTIRNS